MGTMGQRLKLVREDRGISQAALADRVGVKQQTIGALESGGARKTAYLVQIAEALGVDAGWLQTGRGRAPTLGEHAGEHLGNTPDLPPAPIDRDVLYAPEYDVRAAAGDGFVIDHETQKGAWPFPRSYLRHVLGISSNELAVIEVVGDSMSPTLESGDRVLVDLKDRRPAPPGLFVLWDGDGTVVKRVERVLNSRPALLAITSDNPRHRTYERPAEEISIVGRVVWYARRL